MATVIALSNIKGGVAKTTTTQNLGAGLNKRGYRVLLIDADPQVNLSAAYFSERVLDEIPEEETLYGVFKNGAEIQNIKRNVKPGLDIVIGSYELCTADIEFFQQAGSSRKIKNAIRGNQKKGIKGVEEEYDYILIDCPPSMGILTINAFLASNYILAPMSAEAFSLKATRILKRVIGEWEEELEEGEKLPVIGVLVTRYNSRSRASKGIEKHLESAAELLDTTLFERRIRHTTRVIESQMVHMDLFDYCPKEPVTDDCNAFVDEFLMRVKGE